MQSDAIAQLWSLRSMSNVDFRPARVQDLATLALTFTRWGHVDCTFYIKNHCSKWMFQSRAVFSHGSIGKMRLGVDCGYSSNSPLNSRLLRETYWFVFVNNVFYVKC
jgi:hypothetical protein